ncbi:RDD family protein [compost metagenome]
MKYTIVIDGKPEGPYELEELKTMQLTPGTFVRKPGMDDYKEAHEVEELRELFGFRYQQTAPQYFASFDQRLTAMVIDYFFIILAYVIFLLLLFIFINGKEQRISTGLFLLPLIGLVKIVYSSFAEASAQQATIGKRILTIRVTDIYGKRLTLANSFGRNLAKFISIIPFYFGYLYSFLNKKQQTFHDIIANTLIVKQRLL